VICGFYNAAQLNMPICLIKAKIFCTGKMFQKKANLRRGSGIKIALILMFKPGLFGQGNRQHAPKKILAKLPENV
jgi:hypothetical protein